MILSPTVPNWMATPQESTYPHLLCHRNAATSYIRVALCQLHQTINLELFSPLTDSSPVASMLKSRRLSI